MAVCLINKSGGGISSDDVTAKREHVVKGYATITVDSNDEIVEGLIEDRGEGAVVAFAIGREDWNHQIWATFGNGWYHRPPHPAGHEAYIYIKYEALANLLGVDSAKMLESLTVADRRGQIKIIDTAASNYRINKSTNFWLDNWTNPSNPVFYVDFPYGSAYYTRPDGRPHVCIDAANLGTAGADSVLSGQTATSVQGVKFAGAIQRWICTTGDVITALGGEGFVYDDTHASRGRGIVTKIPNNYFVQGANWVFLSSPNLYPWNIKAGVNINGVVGTMQDYSAGRPVFENATFNTLYVGGVANKDFPEARIYRDRTQSHNKYSRYIGGTTISVSAGSDFHLWSNGLYVGFVLDRAILFTFFRQLKITYKLDVRMHTGRYNRLAGVMVYVNLYDAENRSRLLGGRHEMHSSSERVGSTYNGDTYEMIIDTSNINKDAFVALCANAYSDDNMSSAIGSVTFTKIELIN